MQKIPSKFKMLLFAAMLFMLHSGYAYAETAPGKENEKAAGILISIGEVKAVDCNSGEIKILSRKGEEVFYLNKDTKYEDVKACGDLAAGGMIKLGYLKVDQKNTATSVRFRPKNPEAEKAKAEMKSKRAASGKKQKGLMGFVNTIDCEKGLIIVEQMDDRTKKESVNIIKETGFDTGSPSNACKDIVKESLVSVIYLEQEGKKAATKIKVMLKDTK